jgi:hypothetical protein
MLSTSRFARAAILPLLLAVTTATLIARTIGTTGFGKKVAACLNGSQGRGAARETILQPED